MGIADYQIIVSNIGKIVLGINTILFLIVFFRNEKAYKIFTGYLFLMSIVQFFTYYLWKEGVYNLHLAHYYLTTQFIILSLFYYTLFKNKTQKWLVISVLIIIVIILIIQSYILPELLYRFNLLEIVLTSLPIVFFSVIQFYNSLSEKRKFMYVNSGIFIYILTSTLIFCSGNIVNDITTEFRTLLWFMNVILYLVYQLLISAEWFLNFRKKDKEVST
ncbi:hypothetical protein U8527_13845 [Kordia algicida OT-1]|uniref:Uncharacterized protein n=1 Tax=Kordia algicida OT-1 TaxID=391587 RepID=A9DXC3_9FLAO|nr:hypothetical protein [Kordia algicida]EDP95986.1 hypothetical protein KAOT1_07453 [Kordia algicida OT-1]